MEKHKHVFLFQSALSKIWLLRERRTGLAAATRPGLFIPVRAHRDDDRRLTTPGCTRHLAAAVNEHASSEATSPS